MGKKSYVEKYNHKTSKFTSNDVPETIFDAPQKNTQISILNYPKNERVIVRGSLGSFIEKM